MRIKRSTSFTLDEEHIKMLREMADGLNVTASELLDSLIEFYYYNNFASWARSARGDSKIVVGGKYGISS